jgi:DMSO/TMAO reductase YedYZ molybdopterin-dependent catalytic subunit
MAPTRLPPNQQLVATAKWPLVGERLPREDFSPWMVSVSGAVERQCSYSLEELRTLPQIEQTLDIHCVTRWSKLDVRFAGVSLAVLLAAAKPRPDARFVSFVARSNESHSTSLPLETALTLQTLIALSADGLPLPVEHGGPVRVVVPHRYFYKSLKWLERIELLSEDRLGTWERSAGYHNNADPWLEQRYIASGLSKQQTAKLLASKDLSGLDLLGLDAAGRELSGLIARRALLRDANFRGCQLTAADFAGANLSNAHFDGAQLVRASFASADVEGASFNGADLRGADFRGASLVGASFCDELDPEHGAMVDRTTLVDAAAFDQLTPVQRQYLFRIRVTPGGGA